ncbi:hypothetical protein ILUMI_15101 [Ignelater luminosus]|uniref:Uncharacterized protein n=1 Tax=Ignelater luminosus TaxID=2038154 RepID=A0A8K0GA98_IGNLU|nr:hypothetical protein ILUMI_15101 [Ignelater luminosus]
MTAQLFEEWFENSLLPSLPPNSVIVLDNASYYSRQLNKIPNTNSTKAELMEFLYEQNIYFEESYTKKQLLGNSVKHVMKIEAEYMKIHQKHPPVVIQITSGDDSDDSDFENISE